MKRKIGLLFSLSGTVSIVGAGQLQAALLAIEQVNNTSGGVQFEAVVRDAKSDPNVVAREAYSLFKEVKVDAMVGCYLSSERNALIPILNDTKGLLLYPTLYEGGQLHPNIFYLGAVPNQQVEPLLSWAIQNVSRDFVLVGSDYVYPRMTNRQVRQWVENAGGSVRNETYFPLASNDYGNFFQELGTLSRSCSSISVFSTIVGTSAVSFYREYRRRKIPYPILSTVTTEREFNLMGKDASVGHVCSSPYFRNIEGETNHKFINAFENRFGDQPINREMAATFDAIHLLHSAYCRLPAGPSRAGETERVRMALKNLPFQGIQGRMVVDPNSQHVWHWSRIGRVNADGRLETIWESPGPVPPKIDADRNTLVLRERPDPPATCEAPFLVGTNPDFLECTRMAQIAGNASCSVLITGETGTGKELLARYIHASGPRRNSPFIPINCTALPRELIESELFGYEDGAFTGARKGGKPGKFEMANGGTFFLDEIGDMPSDLQAHLLRVIEESEVYRIGGTKPIRLDVRLIAATNKNLSDAISKGAFRKDLFYRLSGFHISLPNLCDRPDDIPVLVEHFLERLCRKSGMVKTLSEEAMHALQNHSWPGNVRELANVVERSFYLSLDSEVIRPCHFPGYITHPGYSIVQRDKQPAALDAESPSEQDPNGMASVKETEERLIRQTLAHSGNNLSRAAVSLGISRTTLYRKMKKYLVETPDKHKYHAELAASDRH